MSIKGLMLFALVIGSVFYQSESDEINAFYHNKLFYVYAFLV